MRTFVSLGLLFILPSSGMAQRGLKPEEVPTFQLRARVVEQQGKVPADKKFSFRLDASNRVMKTTGGEWSDWLVFGQKEVEKNLKGYPAIYLRGYPVVVRLIVGGVADPTVVEVELQFQGNNAVKKMSGELFGSRLGILIWREDKAPRAATMAEYNRRYWKVLQGGNFPEKYRPRLFPIVDRFIGGDDDRRAWKDGIQKLSSAGFSVLMLPPSSKIRNLLLQTRLKRTSWAVYNPPGYAFDFDAKITPKSIQAWADKIATSYQKAGYDSKDMALFAMSDEPGWYYPQMLDKLKKSAEGMKRFHAYLKKQNLHPGDLGAQSWDEVEPIGASQAKELPSRRLFYWTMRFFPYDSAQHFANSTRALEKAFYPGLPVLTNWNFFSGRLYVPGPVANNRDKRHPDAAMGGHDWFEFSRLRGCTMLWTEDWFPDSKAYQWSFYCSRLRCAAKKGGMQFGGYVIPRTAGDRDDGILQRILCIVGSGGKAVKYFVFGPEYNFPGNCYSERAKVLPKMAEAHRMIGQAEDLLWNGHRPASRLAILAPRSAQMWDARGIEIQKKIRDATNTNLNGATVDYMAEVFDLYLALQHANIPVDFVDEDDLTKAGLQRYQLLYITEPNIPAESQQSIADWVRAGGTLVTVSNAGTHDRYDEPCPILSCLTGLEEQPRKRLLVANTNALKLVGTVEGPFGKFSAAGVRGAIKKHKGEILARWKDGSAAIIQTKVDKGIVIHFAFLPGLSYWKSSTTTKDRLPVGFSKELRDAIVYPVQLCQIKSPVEVDVPLVEAPLLSSDKGAAVTLLNWTGEPIDQLNVQVRVPFPVTSVESVRHGQMKFTVQKGGVGFSLPLKSADIVMVRK